MADLGGGVVTWMEGTTENVDVDLENVSPSFVSRYFHGSIVKGALDTRQESEAVGEREVPSGLQVYEVCHSETLNDCMVQSGIGLGRFLFKIFSFG